MNDGTTQIATPQLSLPCMRSYMAIPPIHIPYFPKDSNNETIDALLIKKEKRSKSSKVTSNQLNTLWYN
jgi:hypothetical protein